MKATTRESRFGWWFGWQFAAIIGIAAVVLGIGSAGAATPSRGPAADTAQTLAAYTEALAAGAPHAGYFAEDAVLTFGDSGQQIRGQEGVAQAIADLYHGAFAGRMTVTDRMVVGGAAAMTGEFIGTQIGAFAGLAPTGNTMHVPYTAFYELADSRITALRLHFSTAEILRQLTAPPATETPSPWPSGRPY